MPEQADLTMDTAQNPMQSESGNPDSAVEAEPVTPGRETGGFLFNIPFLIVSLLVSIVGVLVFQMWEIRHGVAQAQYVRTASNMLMLAERLTRESHEAVRGGGAAYDALRGSQQEFGRNLAALDDVEKGFFGVASAQVRVKLALVHRAWANAERRLESIVARQDAVVTTREQVRRVDDAAAVLLTRCDEMVEAVIAASGDPRHVNNAGRLCRLSQQIAKDAAIYGRGGQAAQAAVERLGQDIESFRSVTESVRALADASTLVELDEIDQIFGQVSRSVAYLRTSSEDVFAAHMAAEKLIGDTAKVIETVQDLIAAYYVAYEARATAWLPWVFGLLSVLSLVLLGRALLVNARARAERSARQNLETQDAILKLLDEMGSLADGDLTIEAEVTDQITGAIADSVNFAVKEMRELVQRINVTSQHIAQESERTSKNARRLSDASAKQAEYINRTTEQVLAMAESMSEMSTEARRSTEVAKSSVEVAERGAKAVRDTVRSMTEMRQQIQQTSKRIKRLGESSQLIGEIVRLIEDLAEQTNILSMNAAIQAGMAGDAGRGFTIVADEVQQLAERSAEATKQITELVKNIQFDTNEAVTSMEQATRGVVEGATLADAAGRALVEIETVSENFAKLVAQIQAAARDQSQKATEVSSRMTKIRDVSTATSRDARRTARAIDQLTTLAHQLRESVSRFKIPERGKT